MGGPIDVAPPALLLSTLELLKVDPLFVEEAGAHTERPCGYPQP